MLLNIAWMLSIVFLPVATALIGSLETDRAQVALYIGTMALSSVLMLAMYVLVGRRRDLWSSGAGPTRGGLSAQASLVVLFGLALVVGVVFPAVNYYALLLLTLTSPIQVVLARIRPD